MLEILLPKNYMVMTISIIISNLYLSIIFQDISHATFPLFVISIERLGDPHRETRLSPHNDNIKQFESFTKFNSACTLRSSQNIFSNFNFAGLSSSYQHSTRLLDQTLDNLTGNGYHVHDCDDKSQLYYIIPFRHYFQQP